MKIKLFCYLFVFYERILKIKLFNFKLIGLCKALYDMYRNAFLCIIFNLGKFRTKLNFKSDKRKLSLLSYDMYAVLNKGI